MSCSFKQKSLSIDLEIDVKDNKLFNLAAVRGDNGASISLHNNSIHSLLSKLDDFADDLSYLLGHNIISHDVPHLKVVKPGLKILNLPCIDTLMLNPLVFPRNPYHHLVKHYISADICRQSINDPELDSRLALTLFDDQCEELMKLQNESPELLTIWHWLTTIDGSYDGFDILFKEIRATTRPEDEVAKTVIYDYIKDKGCVNNAVKIINDAVDIG